MTPVLTPVMTEARRGLTNRAPEAPVARHGGRVITLAELLGDAQTLRRRLPEAASGAPLINACQGRYAFLVGFVACLLAGRPCLLPGDRGVQRVAHLRARHPGCEVLTDDAGAGGIVVPTVTGARADPREATVADGLVTTIAFTSGTTGDPVEHTRSWGSQVLQIDALAERLGLIGDAPASVVATVPFGHMYGFELTILMPLRASVAIHTGTPLYAEDIRQALEAVPAPRVLVTSPFHLRALAGLTAPVPAIARVISATAPLGAGLAQRIEDRFATEVHEIYGCTEAGSVATRRTVDAARWRPVDGVRFAAVGTTFQVEVPGMRGAVPLADVLALDPDGGFELLGRIGDLIKVGGKRGSLTALTNALLAIDGVTDGVVVMPDEEGAPEGDGAMRPVALAVAPGLTAGDVLKALRRLVDPAFVPRRAILLDALPRDALGKLQRAEVTALLTSRTPEETSVTVVFDADHPALPGHFPGRPLVPGVVLLDAIVREARDAFELGPLAGIAQAKFRHAVPPGAATEVALRRLAAARVGYQVRLNGQVVATGELGFADAGVKDGPT
ncbi:MAG: AMP-binding protein [Alphaproteobacteria bacterium]|nr:AMP-binding protein [Alphaproteobacteria bacterium]